MKNIFVPLCVFLSFANPSVSTAKDYGKLSSFSDFFDKIVVEGRYSLIIFAKPKGGFSTQRAYLESIKLINRWVGKNSPSSIQLTLTYVSSLR